MKKSLLIFLIILILLVPNYRFSYGIQPSEFAAVEVGQLCAAILRGVRIFDIVGAVKAMGTCIIGAFVGVILTIIDLVNFILQNVINLVASLNPFSSSESGQSPAETLWNILRSLSFILLSYAGLFAGFQWLFGEDRSAKIIIFNIVIVSLLINFTFTIVKELFYISRAFEAAITGGASGTENSYIGTALTDLLYGAGDVFKFASENENKDPLYVLAAIFLASPFRIFVTIILAVLAAIYVIRYVYIIILAGFSSIALASLTIPEFGGKIGQVLKEVTSNLKLFYTWLNQLIKWMIVVPLFIFMIIIGAYILRNFIFSSANNDLVQLLLGLLIIGIWFWISIKTAVSMSGKLAQLASVATTGAFTLLGLEAVGLIGPSVLRRLDLSKRLIDVGKKVETTAELPVPIRRLGSRIKSTGEAWHQKLWLDLAEFEKSRMDEAVSRLNAATTDEEKNRAIEKINQILKENQRRPEVLKSISSSLNLVNQRDREYILMRAAEQGFLSKETSPELRKAFTDTITKIPADSLVNLLQNKDFSSHLINASLDVIYAFADRIGEVMKDKEAAKLFQKLGGNTEIWKRLYQKEELRKALDKVSDRIFSSIVENLIDPPSAEEVLKRQTELFEKLSKTESVYKNWANIRTSINALMVAKNIDKNTRDKFINDLLLTGLNNYTLDSINGLYSDRFKLNESEKEVISDWARQNEENIVKKLPQDAQIKLGAIVNMKKASDAIQQSKDERTRKLGETIENSIPTQ